MRQSVVDALLGDARVSGLVGSRVYVGRGPFGGISRDLTPEAFDGDGDLLPSIVVRLETRSLVEGGRSHGADALLATQTIALWCYAQHEYDVIFEVIRAAKARLHRANLRPVVDPVAWAETLWSTDGAEQLDAALEPPVPVVVSRYQATVRDLFPA